MFELSSVPVPDLSGKTILVTGAGRGIGAELVRQLANHGAQVFAGVYRQDVEGLVENPKMVTHIQLDVTSGEQVEAAIDRVQREAGRLDVLVNNAGIISPSRP